MSSDSDDNDFTVAAAEELDCRVRKNESSYHHGDLRGALVRAGLMILREQGAHRLSLREAARIAGVSQAAPYRHFANKEALIAAIAQEGYAMLAQAIRNVVQTYRNNTEEQFHQTALVYLALALEHTDHFRLMYFSVPPLQVSKHPDLERVSLQVFKEFISIVQRCQRERILRNGDVSQLAVVAWAGIHGLVSLIVNQKLEFMNIKSEQLHLLMRATTRNLIDGLKSAR